MRIYHIIQSMLAQKGANAIKIVSVSVGLLMSTFIFSFIGYNYSYDTFFRDRDNLYQVWTEYYWGGEHIGPNEQCVGKMGAGVLEALGDEIDGATLLCRMYGGEALYNGDERIDARLLGVDSLFFQTMGIDVISGNPQKDLAAPGVVYLSESTAREIFGGDDPIGRTLTIDRKQQVTVSGIFRDIPTETTIQHFQAAVSFPTCIQLGYTNINWAGGDSWPCYFRLRKDSGLTEKEIDSRLNRMYQSHTPDSGEDRTVVSGRPIRNTYLQNETVRRMNLILWILGSALLLMTTLNYALITIASLSRRAKSIGVHKCSGAGPMTIMGMFLTETLVILLCSSVIIAGIFLILDHFATEYGLFKPSISEIFSGSPLWIPCAVLLFFLIVGGIIPGRIFSKIPVTQVFRRFTERNSAWKRSLLFVQIAGVSFIGCLLSIVTLQYREVVSHDMGFSVDRIATFDIPRDIDSEAFKATVANLPYVEDLAAAGNSPLGGYSGQNVYDGTGKIIFNTRIGWINHDFVRVMGMKLVEGRHPEKRGEAIINQEFSHRIGFGDHPVGKPVTGCLRDTPTVVGMVENFNIGGFTEGLKPVILISVPYFGEEAFVRLREPSVRNCKQLTEFLDTTYPGHKFNCHLIEEDVNGLYSDVIVFRNCAFITTLALILISLMGLIGFSRDEVQRRSKEIAIRKVNGAEASDIINLLLSDVVRLALPAVVTGCLCAAYIGHIWLSSFTISVPDIWLWYILTGLIVLMLVCGCVLSVTAKVARETPVRHLKSE